MLQSSRSNKVWQAPKARRIESERLHTLETDTSIEVISGGSSKSTTNQATLQKINATKIQLLTRTGINASRISLLSEYSSRASTTTSYQQSITSQYEEYKSDLLPMKLLSARKTQSNPRIIDSRTYKEVFSRTDRQAREKYLAALKHNNMLGSKYPKKIQGFIILDWEGTLFRGTDLEEVKYNEIPSKGKPTIRTLDKAIRNLLEELSQNLQVFLMTYSHASTVTFNAQFYLPLTYEIMVKEKIEVISMRGSGVSEDDQLSRKVGTARLKEIFTKDLPTNMIGVVDSEGKMSAMESLGRDLQATAVKIIKFKEYSKVTELIKQQEIFLKQFENIFDSLRSFTLHLAKKQS